MAKNNNVSDFTKDLADAIRAKKGTTATINPQNFSSEIASIDTAKQEEVISRTFGVNGSYDINPTTSNKTISKVHVFVDVDKPRLNAPKASISKNKLTVDTSENGRFGDYYFLERVDSSGTLEYEYKIEAEHGSYQSSETYDVSDALIPESAIYRIRVGGDDFETSPAYPIGAAQLYQNMPYRTDDTISMSYTAGDMSAATILDNFSIFTNGYKNEKGSYNSSAYAINIYGTKWLLNPSNGTINGGAAGTPYCAMFGGGSDDETVRDYIVVYNAKSVKTIDNLIEAVDFPNAVGDRKGIVFAGGMYSKTINIFTEYGTRLTVLPQLSQPRGKAACGSVFDTSVGSMWRIIAGGLEGTPGKDTASKIVEAISDKGTLQTIESLNKAKIPCGAASTNGRVFIGSDGLTDVYEIYEANLTKQIMTYEKGFYDVVNGLGSNAVFLNGSNSSDNGKPFWVDLYLVAHYNDLEPYSDEYAGAAGTTLGDILYLAGGQVPSTGEMSDKIVKYKLK